MTERIKLFPGVTIPRSIALAVKFGTIEDRIGDDAATWAGSPDGLGSINSEAVATIEDVERFLAEKRARGRKRELEFRSEEDESRNYHWRRDGFQKSRYKEPSRRPIDPLEAELREAYKSEVPATNSHLGTNRILDYFDFAEGKERNDFLRSFNGDCFYGANVIRAAFQIGRFYGLSVDASRTVDEEKGIFKALALAVHAYGTTLTDRVVEAFGLKNLVGVVENYTPIRIYKRDLDLVPTKDLVQIVSALNSPAFEGMGSKGIMRELGYRVLRDPMGVPLLYHKPNTT